MQEKRGGGGGGGSSGAGRLLRGIGRGIANTALGRVSSDEDATEGSPSATPSPTPAITPTISAPADQIPVSAEDIQSLVVGTASKLDDHFGDFYAKFALLASKGISPAVAVETALALPPTTLSRDALIRVVKIRMGSLATLKVEFASSNAEDLRGEVEKTQGEIQALNDQMTRTRSDADAAIKQLDEQMRRVREQAEATIRGLELQKGQAESATARLEAEAKVRTAHFTTASRMYEESLHQIQSALGL
jgi:hypothetical protein